MTGRAGSLSRRTQKRPLRYKDRVRRGERDDDRQKRRDPPTGRREDRARQREPNGHEQRRPRGGGVGGPGHRLTEPVPGRDRKTGCPQTLAGPFERGVRERGIPAHQHEQGGRGQGRNNKDRHAPTRTERANFDTRIGPGDVVLGSRRAVGERGWRITYRVDADDGGFPSLEFYSTHRMTNDRHVRIWADGYLERLDAMHEFYAYDPKVPGLQEAAEEKYLRHNQAVGRQLRARGLYPHGDINTFLRTGGTNGDDGSGQ
jgi:hypothetical protein